MFTLIHNNEKLGTSQLESGDPSTLNVSGIFHNIGGPIALAGWIKSIGGQEDSGVVFTPLNSDFRLVDKDDKIIPFKEATLISVPADKEAYLDVSGLTAESYANYFSEHIAATNES